MQINLRFDDSGNHIRFADAAAKLGDRRATQAYLRATNHTGDRMRTRVVRALASQTGLTATKLRGLGQPVIHRARPGRLEYVIRAYGPPIPLKEFGAKQFRFGVRARPWGRTQRFPGAFIYAGKWNSGNPAGGGHVFVRTSGDSLPLELLYGPSIAAELVKDASRQAWEDAQLALGERVEHEIRRLTGGVVG